MAWTRLGPWPEQSQVTEEVFAENVEAGLVLLTRDFVSVKDYGAVGDGATDDTAAIQSAIDNNAKIYFPASSGGYGISSTGLKIPSNRTLVGCGYPGRLVRIGTYNATQNLVVNLGATTGGTPNDNISILNLYIDGVKSGASGTTQDNQAAQGILIRAANATTPTDRCRNITIRDCEIVNFPGQCIHLQNVEYFTIAGNRVKDSSRDGICVDFNSKYGAVTGNVVVDSQDDGIACNGMLETGSFAYDGWVEDVTITGNTVRVNTTGSVSGAQALALRAVKNIEAVGNKFEGGTAAVVDVMNWQETESQDVKVSENQIRQGLGCGVRLWLETNDTRITVSENDIYNSGKENIQLYVDNATGVVSDIEITGNRCYESHTQAGGSRCGISLSGVSGSVASRVCVERNRVYKAKTYSIFNGSNLQINDASISRNAIYDGNEDNTGSIDAIQLNNVRGFVASGNYHADSRGTKRNRYALHVLGSSQDGTVQTPSGKAADVLTSLLLIASGLTNVTEAHPLASGADAQVGAASNHGLLFKTNATERARMPADGSYALDLNSGTYTTPIRMKNASYIVARNNAGNADVNLFRLNTADEYEVNQAMRLASALRLNDGVNITSQTTTGTKIGTATTQKLGFWNATPVVRPTGWGAPTGTATRTTYATSTATVTQLAERLKALIDDLTTIGLIGS
jgi:hypothetical protein